MARLALSSTFTARNTPSRLPLRRNAMCGLLPLRWRSRKPKLRKRPSLAMLDTKTPSHTQVSHEAKPGSRAYKPSVLILHRIRYFQSKLTVISGRPTALGAGSSTRATSWSRKSSHPATAGRVTRDNASSSSSSSSERGKRTKKSRTPKSRSISRGKRTSMFGNLMGKKEGHDEKAESDRPLHAGSAAPLDAASIGMFKRHILLLFGTDWVSLSCSCPLCST